MDEDEGYLCTECGKIHREDCNDFKESGELPLFNSPRVGACNYKGGSIDLERDGFYKAG